MAKFFNMFTGTNKPPETGVPTMTDNRPQSVPVGLRGFPSPEDQRSSSVPAAHQQHENPTSHNNDPTLNDTTNDLTNIVQQTGRFPSPPLMAGQKRGMMGKAAHDLDNTKSVRTEEAVSLFLRFCSLFFVSCSPKRVRHMHRLCYYGSLQQLGLCDEWQR